MPRRRSTPYSLVIFDFDGTIADSAEWFGREFNGVARRYRFREVAAHEATRLRDLDNRAIMLAFGVPRWKVPFIAAHMRRLMARDIAEIHLFPGVPAMLRNLRAAGVRLAVVSSNSRDNVRAVLGAEAALIDHYACGTSLFGKAAKFRAIAGQAGVASGGVIAIGDEARDIEAAADASIASGAVTWGYASPDLLRSRRPTHIFDAVEQILAAIVPNPDLGTPPAAPSVLGGGDFTPRPD